MTNEKVVFVTGGTGFLGRHAVHKLLRNGYEVHVASRNWLGPFAPSAQMRIHECDLFDVDYVDRLLDMIQPTNLLHLAWETTHGVYQNSPENLKWVEASLAMLRSFEAYGGRRAVFAGSGAEYGEVDGPCDEYLTPLRPQNLYGVCKSSLRAVAEQYAQQTGMSVAWGRLFNLYGPGEDQQRLIPSLVKSLMAGEPAVCHNGGLIRDYLHVSDAADALVSLLHSDVTGPVNIAAGQPITLEDLAQRLSGIVSAGQSVLVEEGAPSIDQPREVTAATARLQDEVGWTPAVTLNEGLRSVVTALQKQSLTRAA